MLGEYKVCIYPKYDLEQPFSNLLLVLAPVHEL